MVQGILALALAVASQLGGAYPHGRPTGPIQQGRCTTAYRLVTADPIADVAAFYKTQAAVARTALLDDSGARFPDYRTLSFSTRPRFLFVVLSREAGKTVAQVRYHLAEPDGCR